MRARIRAGASGPAASASKSVASRRPVERFQTARISPAARAVGPRAPGRSSSPRAAAPLAATTKLQSFSRRTVRSSRSGANANWEMRPASPHTIAAASPLPVRVPAAGSPAGASKPRAALDVLEKAGEILAAADRRSPLAPGGELVEVREDGDERRDERGRARQARAARQIARQSDVGPAQLRKSAPQPGRGRLRPARPVRARGIDGAGDRRPRRPGRGPRRRCGAGRPAAAKRRRRCPVLRRRAARGRRTRPRAFRGLRAGPGTNQRPRGFAPSAELPQGRVHGAEELALAPRFGGKEARREEPLLDLVHGRGFPAPVAAPIPRGGRSALLEAGQRREHFLAVVRGLDLQEHFRDLPVGGDQVRVARRELVSLVGP